MAQRSSSLVALALAALAGTSCMSVASEARTFSQDRETVYNASMQAVGSADWWTLIASDRESGLISCAAGDSLGLWRGGGTHQGKATILVSDAGQDTSVNVRVECAGAGKRLAEFWRCLGLRLQR